MYSIGWPTLHVFGAVHAGVPLGPWDPRRIGPACPKLLKVHAGGDPLPAAHFC